MKKQNKSLNDVYNFEDFTEKNYVKLIKIAKKNYSFELYGSSTKRQHVLWRHDVDVSVHRALCLAKIEHQLSVKATYFFRLHSEFYNIFEKPIYEIINQILHLGHQIGLHFDMDFYTAIKTKKQLQNKLLFEKKILEQLFYKQIIVFSFHNPEMGNALKFDDNKISGMINTYGKTMKNNYGYCSDSNGYWRYGRLEDVLSNAADHKLQILTHPEWWQKKSMSPKQRIHRCIDGRAINIKNVYDKMLKELGRKNIE